MNDNEQRDELAELLANTQYPNLNPAWPLREDRSPVKFFSRKQADAILAAGYSKPRTITTAEEVDALPVGPVVLDTDGFPSRKFAGGWRTMVAEPDGSAWLSGHMEDPEFPATVIHEPTTEATK